MPKLPKLSGAELISILETFGYVQLRTKGSHVRMCPPKPYTTKKITVPLHKQLKAGTLRAILRDTGLRVEDLVK